MTQLDGDDKPLTPKEQAKAVILKTLGVARVATWCGVGEMTVYQWLARGTDEKPIPPDRVPSIVRGARADGIEVDPTHLWPEARDLAA